MDIHKLLQLIAGSIAVAWRLNETISENIEILEAYNLILKYLTSKQVSPLEIAFVENNDPLATSVSSDTLEVVLSDLTVSRPLIGQLYFSKLANCT